MQHGPAASSGSNPKAPGSAGGYLLAIGTLALESGRRPTLRENLPPPPRLSSGWLGAADDGSYEFALAAALASVSSGSEDNTFRLPFRRHLGALRSANGREGWDDTTKSRALAVWTGRDLLRDMSAVLERRLIEAQRRKFANDNTPELPLRGRRSAPLAAVAEFLAERTDDNRIAVLTAGLAWVFFNAGPPTSGERENILPFAYAALKPLLHPKGIGSEDRPKRFVDPLPLIRVLYITRWTRFRCGDNRPTGGTSRRITGTFCVA